MTEAHDFGIIVLLVAAGFLLAVFTSRFSERVSIPGPAIFLLAAAVAADLFPRLGDVLGIRQVERIGVVALIVILFDGGARIGLRRFRGVAAPVLSLGVLGTFATAGAVTLGAHWLLGFGWVSFALPAQTTLR